MKKRLISAALLISMLASLTACAGEGGSSETTADSTTAPAETTADPAKTLDLPDKDWGGKTFTVLGRSDANYPQFNNFEIYAESENGDVVNDAVFRRNTTIEDKYNVTIAQELVTAPHTELGKLALAGDDVYDAVFCELNVISSLMTNGYLYDLNSVDYIDTSKDWWNQTANETLTVYDKLFFASSDFALRDKSPTWILIYNKELAENYNIPNIADIVREGKWTTDKMGEYVKLVSQDLNGNSEHDLDDSWGITFGNYTAFPAMVLGCENGLVRNQGGELELVMNTERMHNTIDALLKIANKEDSFYAPEWNGRTDGDYWGTSSKVFKSGRGLITAGVPYSLSGYSRDCDFEYGIIPMPKLDEAQEKHYTTPDTTALLFGIPAIDAEPEFSGFMLEALSAYSTDTTLPAYYETSCKTKYTYDADSAEMLDLIFDGIVFEPAQLFGIGNLWGILTSIAQSRNNTLASSYASAESSALKSIETLKETFSEIE